MKYCKPIVLLICFVFAQSASGYDGTLIKRIGVANTVNNTFYQELDKKAETLDNYLMENLKKTCPDVIFQQFEKLSEMDHRETALRGRNAGMNAVVTCRLTDIRGNEEELGFWFFEKVVYFAEVHVRIAVYDTETASKLFLASFEDEMEIEKEQFEALASKTAAGNLPETNKLIENLALRISEEICDALEDEPFKAFLSSVEGDKAVVTSGSNSGLAAGMKFKVFDCSNSIQGKENKLFYLKGDEVGEIEIVSTAPDHSEGQIISGSFSSTDVCLKEQEEESWFKNLFN